LVEKAREKTREKAREKTRVEDGGTKDGGNQKVGIRRDKGGTKGG
jgi:hypothetical protein